jgi:hypothetical protein
MKKVLFGFILTALAACLVGCGGCSASDGLGKKLDERRYLSTPSVVMGTNLIVVAGQPTLASPPPYNPFPDDSPIVLIGGVAPVGMNAATVYYVTGYGTATLRFYALSGQSLAFTTNSDVQKGATIYPVDWSLIHAGTVSLAADGVIPLPSASLGVGDTVYLAAAAGNATLTTGTYLVARITGANSFTLEGAVVTAGDAITFVARVGNNGGTAF